MLVTNPDMQVRARTINDPVETRQIACTILNALDLDCAGLMSVQIEPSKSLPHSNHVDAESDAVHGAGWLRRR